MSKIFTSKIVGAILLLLLVFFVGVFGFIILYDYTFIDAMYMTVITITTVGFGEIHAPTASEKIFISILILSSIFIVGYAIKVISEYILSKNNIGNLRQKKLEKRIANLEDHIIVCGYGRNGKQAVQKIAAYKKPFLIIERDEDLIERYQDENLLFVHGNASEDEVLLEAGVDKASSLICALPSDADNLFVVLSARQINKDLKIISRATQETSRRKLKLAGADNVILPDKIGGDHMASLLVVPDLIEFIDNLGVSGEGDSANVEQISFEKVCAGGQPKAINELDLRKNTGCSIIGYKNPQGNYIVNPEPETVLEPNSKLILIGRPDQIEKLKKLYDV